MTQAWVLGQRALREGWRTPEALLPTLFIPLFFLVVNVGQAAKIFPSSSTAFLHGQGYGAFQLPSSLLLAASFGTAALFLVEDIEGGYFDKLRAAPVPRTALVLGRLIAESVKGVLIATALVLLGLIFGIHCERSARLRAPRRPHRPLGRRLRRFHAAHRAQDAKRGGDQLRRARLLPAALPHPELRAPRPAHQAHGGGGNVQPGHVRDGGPPLPDPSGPRVEPHPARLRRGRRPRRGDGCPQRPSDPPLRLTPRLAFLRGPGLNSGAFAITPCLYKSLVIRWGPCTRSTSWAIRCGDASSSCSPTASRPRARLAP